MKTKMTVCVGIAVAGLLRLSAVEVDFSKEVGSVRRELHSSGIAPRLYLGRRTAGYDVPEIKALNMYATRTHDWALINQGQRVIDMHHIFPLEHLDAKDPSNYYFKATDEAIRLAREDAGLEIFYRLGTSIEHSVGKHFNTLAPKNDDNYAEAMAGIIRHYNRGWADGFEWNIKYWEIYNEPDCGDICWAGDGGTVEEKEDRFCRLFVTCLKRLKREYPELKIGGPAFSWLKWGFIEKLCKACDEAGVRPDFLSWHCYSNDPSALAAQPDTVRQWLDARGWTDVKTVLNEWHYLKDPTAWDGLQHYSHPSKVRDIHEGPAGHWNIDSGVFNLVVLSRFQYTTLWQSYYYGSGVFEDWGYLDWDANFTKVYHSLKAFGEIVRYPRLVSVEDAGNVSLIAALSEDGTRGCMLVSDYRGEATELKVTVKGIDEKKVVTGNVSIFDNSHDFTEVGCDYDNGVLTLHKNEPGSAAFLITFTKVN